MKYLNESSSIIANFIVHYRDSINDIKNILNRINNIYIKEGYITSRAYIKPQDLKSGKLVISAVEGKIEDIKGENVNTKLVFISPQNKALNLRYLETGIEQLNRLESFKTTMSVNPSNRVGYSNIIMHREQIAAPYHFDIGVNNYGTVKSGKYQWNITAIYEDLFGIMIRLLLDITAFGTLAISANNITNNKNIKTIDNLTLNTNTLTNNS